MNFTNSNGWISYEKSWIIHANFRGWRWRRTFLGYFNYNADINGLFLYKLFWFCINFNRKSLWKVEKLENIIKISKSSKQSKVLHHNRLISHLFSHSNSNNSLFKSLFNCTRIIYYISNIHLNIQTFVHSLCVVWVFFFALQLS